MSHRCTPGVEEINIKKILIEPCRGNSSLAIVSSWRLERFTEKPVDGIVFYSSRDLHVEQMLVVSNTFNERLNRR